ncbi:hypothetical protein [Novosphingobium sp. UBA1939]|uniref:hypothetical protein n=1 Tax=Novosphingobium sp. UBA1939 TaxID=1946982 RepID=UPI0025CBB55A|nr:hypothetical protein [Novosphingobium sp. UBA1939]
MSSDTNKPADMGQVMHSIGQLTGAVQAMHTGLTARIEDIRQDIQRIESAQIQRMNRMETTFTNRLADVETNVGKRIDSMGARVTALEAEDKRLIAKTARLGALGGGIGGALSAVAIELIKRT